MKNEEAISILEQRSNLLRKFQHIKEAESVEIGKEELNAPALFADQYRKEANAIDLAIRVLKGQPTGDPLTLEQLREMDGQPVWVEFEDGSGGLWGIVHISVFEQIVFPDGLHCTIGKPYYGKIYKAYAYPTAHIDREAWEPCGWCEDLGESRYKLYAGYCMQKAADDFYEEETEELNYCPKCGRPLTEEAWAELEKRMGVRA